MSIDILFTLLAISIIGTLVIRYLAEKTNRYLEEKKYPIGRKEMPFEFDIAISFADENREIAEDLARKLIRNGVRVFYDRFHESDLWGRELASYFQDVYGPKTRFVVLLISKHYPIKDWTEFEFSIIRGEAKKHQEGFILPIMLDDIRTRGIRTDIGHLDYRKVGIDGIVECLLRKLSKD